MAFDPGFLDELRARTPIAAVIGRRTKLSRSGRNWKACCPFHGEKTPSFYVYDDHFHCFGCGVHGDVISFVMQSEGRSFPEAVEQLANEAGLEMPRQDPRQEARAQEARSLGDVLDAVQTVYRLALFQPVGARLWIICVDAACPMQQLSVLVLAGRVRGVVLCLKPCVARISHQSSWCRPDSCALMSAAHPEENSFSLVSCSQYETGGAG